MKAQPIKDMKIVKKMIKAAKKDDDKRNYLIFTLGINSGYRVGDLAGIRVNDIDFDNNQITVIEQKTKKRKTSNINAEVMKVLKAFIKSDKLGGKSCLFTSRTRGSRTPGQKKPLSTMQIDRILKKLVKSAKLTIKISTHTLRKTYAWFIYITSNKNIHLVMELLNHASERTTLRYLGLVDDMEKDCLSNLAMY